jgi:phosphate acetyltransferase
LAGTTGASLRESLRERAGRVGRRLVFPEGDDPRVQQAAAELVRARIAGPVLLGTTQSVSDGLAAAGCDPGSVRILDPNEPEGLAAATAQLLELRAHRGVTREQAEELARDPLVRGALMVRDGEVDGSVGGAVRPTADVLRAALWCVGPAAGITTISSSFYMVVRDFRGQGDEVLTFTDAGVVPAPTTPQLAEIAIAAARARASVVGDEPRVAFLSYSTRGSAAGQHVDRVREALELFRQRCPEVAADGELQADAALIEGVAARKAPGSSVAGRANVLVFPDLAAGNIAYKLVERLASAVAIGPIIQGLARPCNDLSRGASASDVVDVACVTALMAG